MVNDSKFSHRHNSDGTVDSICRECFATVAKAQNESELYLQEHWHTCEPEIVAWYKSLKDAPAA
jgi:hypothetical protein